MTFVSFVIYHYILTIHSHVYVQKSGTDIRYSMSRYINCIQFSQSQAAFQQSI